MTDAGTQADAAGPTRSLVVERLMPHPPEKVWRALTEQPLVAEWLMQNDFAPAVGHRFTFRATPVPGWSGVTNCQVLEVEPPKRLVYSWGDGTESDSGLKTVVTWTLTPEAGGTRVRMEQSGFRPQDEGGYRGMGGGWPRILGGLEAVAAALP
ncbi:MAG: Activator of Hsp90 ATPase 1 family protein [Phenylobacterium sp.]|nr:Activator of Hsp90 ATPase 1 family protein [Phenylobacterium sp.]